MTEREKIYIVPGETHLRRFRPDLERTQHPFDPDAVPEEKLSEGIDCWLLQTWARLRTADTSFEPVICGHAVENAVCLFHYDCVALLGGPSLFCGCGAGGQAAAAPGGHDDSAKFSQSGGRRT